MSSYRAKQKQHGGIRRAATSNLTEVSAKILGRAAAGRDPTANQKGTLAKLIKHCKTEGGAVRVAVHTQCNYKRMRKGYAHVKKRKGKKSKLFVTPTRARTPLPASLPTPFAFPPTPVAHFGSPMRTPMRTPIRTPMRTPVSSPLRPKEEDDMAAFKYWFSRLPSGKNKKFWEKAPKKKKLKKGDDVLREIRSAKASGSYPLWRETAHEYYEMAKEQAKNAPARDTKRIMGLHPLTWTSIKAHAKKEKSKKKTKRKKLNW